MTESTMFSKPGGNRIVSDEGFSIEWGPMYVGITYIEGNQRIFVDSEGLANGRIAVWPDTMRVVGQNTDKLDAETHSRVLENIRLALAFQGDVIELT